MKSWSMLGTVSRYVLAAVSCISLAQFLLLLNVGTENAGALPGRRSVGALSLALWPPYGFIAPEKSAHQRLQMFSLKYK